MQESLPYRFTSPFPSYNEDRWTQLEKSAWRIFHNDWNHSTISTKITKSTTLSTIIWKETWNITDKAKIEKPQEELKVWFLTS